MVQSLRWDEKTKFEMRWETTRLRWENWCINHKKGANFFTKLDQPVWVIEVPYFHENDGESDHKFCVSHGPIGIQKDMQKYNPNAHKQLSK